MKNIIALLFTFSFFVASSQQVDEIIDSYLETIGGVEAIQKIESYKIYASVNQQGLEIPIEIIQSKNRPIKKLWPIQENKVNTKPKIIILKLDLTVSIIIL